MDDVGFRCCDGQSMYRGSTLRKPVEEQIKSEMYEGGGERVGFGGGDGFGGAGGNGWMGRGASGEDGAGAGGGERRGAVGCGDGRLKRGQRSVGAHGRGAEQDAVGLRCQELPAIASPRKKIRARRGRMLV